MEQERSCTILGSDLRTEEVTQSPNVLLSKEIRNSSQRTIRCSWSWYWLTCLSPDYSDLQMLCGERVPAKLYR